MRKIVAVLVVAFLSCNLFAQTVLPVSFKTVNGKTTCEGVGEIRVYFDALPSQLPSIAQVRSEQRDVPGIVIGNADPTDFDKKGYVTYCILSGDILPSGKLSIRFHYEDSGLDYWIMETRSKHVNMGH